MLTEKKIKRNKNSVKFCLMEALLGEEIGRGGFGIVYEQKDDASRAIKVSNKHIGGDHCRQWSHEYKKIMDMIKRLDKDERYRRLKMAKIVKPIEYVDTPSYCYMVMPRIHRPEGSNFKGPTIQAQLGQESVRLVHKGRGEFIGLNEVKEYLSDEDLEVACHELGLLMGLIHHVGKNDAYDVELYLGKEPGKKKPRFYLADFDLSNKVKKSAAHGNEYDSGTLDRMTWSMDAVPYFPYPATPKFFEPFKRGYAKISGQELADKIFAEYG